MASSTGDDASDGDLLAAARNGNREALEALLVRYQSRVYRYGLKVCGDAEDARDVLQDSLLAMARSVREFRAESSLSTWLYTIVHRACLRKRRKSKFAPRHEESLDALGDDAIPATARTPEDEIAGRELDSALNAAIASLDPSQREVFVLRDVEGLTAADVAEVLGLSVEAVKSRLHRARLAMRRRLAPILDVPPAPEGTGPCADVLTLFSRHLEGDLAPDTCARMEAHMARCPRCLGECEALKRALALCRDSPLPRLPASVDQSVRAAIRRFLAGQNS